MCDQYDVTVQNIVYKDPLHTKILDDNIVKVITQVLLATINQFKMSVRALYVSILLCFELAYFANAQFVGTECPLITIDDLGSTANFSTNGLIARSISVLSGEGRRSIRLIPTRIIRYKVLCDTSGIRRNTSSSVSVLVEYVCSDRIHGQAHCNGITKSTWQFLFECDVRPYTRWTLRQLYSVITPIATFSTTSNNRCRGCFGAQAGYGFQEYDSVTQCMSK